jgi:hypothetical protein
VCNCCAVCALRVVVGSGYFLRLMRFCRLTFLLSGLLPSCGGVGGGVFIESGCSFRRSVLFVSGCGY